MAVVILHEGNIDYLNPILQNNKTSSLDKVQGGVKV